MRQSRNTRVENIGCTDLGTLKVMQALFLALVPLSLEQSFTESTMTASLYLYFFTTNFASGWLK
jgi:hypothetical protein